MALQFQPGAVLQLFQLKGKLLAGMLIVRLA